jgi:hypothetical protein
MNNYKTSNYIDTIKNPNSISYINHIINLGKYKNIIDNGKYKNIIDLEKYKNIIKIKKITNSDDYLINYNLKKSDFNGSNLLNVSNSSSLLDFFNNSNSLLYKELKQESNKTYPFLYSIEDFQEVVEHIKSFNIPYELIYKKYRVGKKVSSLNNENQDLINNVFPIIYCIKSNEEINISNIKNLKDIFTNCEIKAIFVPLNKQDIVKKLFIRNSINKNIKIKSFNFKSFFKYRFIGNINNINNSNNTNESNYIMYNLKNIDFNYSTLLHGSNSSSLLAFTNYNNYDGTLYCTGKLIEKGRVPFYGELYVGISKRGINNKYLSTIPIEGFGWALSYSQQYNNSYKFKNNTNYIKHIENINKNEIFQPKKIIYKKRLEEYNKLSILQKSLIIDNFPIIYGILPNPERYRKNNERYIKKIKRNKEVVEVTLGNIYYINNTGYKKYEVGLLTGAFPDEIKAIFVPYNKLEFVKNILNEFYEFYKIKNINEINEIKIIPFNFNSEFRINI